MEEILHHFVCEYLVVSAMFTKKHWIFFPTEFLGIFSIINWSYMSWLLPGLWILSHWSVRLSLCQYYMVLISVALWYFLNQEVWMLWLYSFFNIVLDTLSLYIKASYLSFQGNHIAQTKLAASQDQCRSPLSGCVAAASFRLSTSFWM